ncbi:hypothetical protein [Ahrensia sp. R2A130]|uniref:hypothetical protein n=1 Tax=Ahrensia sp. R2A130 TaxID=744979 RepID=UPI0012EAC398|nr:hypothetical protein [Ahrensia sp. R2A130]
MENHKKRISERDLVFPVLRLIAEFGDEEGGLDISQITHLLRQRLVLSVEDRAILSGRKDDRFSQVVRNLVSHRTLQRKGYATYEKDYRFRRGALFLTDLGAAEIGVTLKPRQPDLFY